MQLPDGRQSIPGRGAARAKALWQEHAQSAWGSSRRLGCLGGRAGVAEAAAEGFVIPCKGSERQYWVAMAALVRGNPFSWLR